MLNWKQSASVLWVKRYLNYDGQILCVGSGEQEVEPWKMANKFKHLGRKMEQLMLRLMLEVPERSFSTSVTVSAEDLQNSCRQLCISAKPWLSTTDWRYWSQKTHGRIRSTVMIRSKDMDCTNALVDVAHCCFSKYSMTTVRVRTWRTGMWKRRVWKPSWVANS